MLQFGRFSSVLGLLLFILVLSGNFLGYRFFSIDKELRQSSANNNHLKMWIFIQRMAYGEKPKAS